MSFFLAWMGCSERNGIEGEIYEVRGVYLGPAYNGQAIVVDHERIPEYMDAMQMTLRLDSPNLLRDIEPGDKIIFSLVVQETGSYIRGIELLPPETELDLVVRDSTTTHRKTPAGVVQ